MRTFRILAVPVLLGGLALPVSAQTTPERIFGPDISTLRPVLRPQRPAVLTPEPDTVRPRLRDNRIPRTRWEHHRRGLLWTRVALSAVNGQGKPLLETVPEDIADWCPAYPEQDEFGRAAFWTALLSTLTRYESTFNPRAVGGGGLWHGLLQILPTTAQLRGCHAVTATALQYGPDNLSCAVRIMARTVPRDGAISVKGERRWLGVAADWGPIRTDWMRRDMQRYTKRQVYCRPLSSVRPRLRPRT